MKQSAYEKVTERILALMEQGVCPWRRPWNVSGLRPHNFATGHHYRGINLFLLSAMAYEQPCFLTFKQAKEMGGAIRKGEKGLPVVYWGKLEIEDEANTYEEKRQIAFLKSFTVFNASQIDGIEFPKPEQPDPLDFQPIEKAEQIVNGWKDGPCIEHGGDLACYCTLTDTIRMPGRERFSSEEEYYSTLFHEQGHATGHQRRLNRSMSGGYGSTAYGKEELVAEMTSAFLCAECGIDNSVIENQTAYLDGWIHTIRSDARLLVTASAQANKAAGIILGREALASEATQQAAA